MSAPLRRRTVLLAGGALAAGGPLLGGGTAPAAAGPAPTAPSTSVAAADAQVAAILKRIRPPHFPDRWYDVTKFGAVGDDATDCTGAIRAAIEACHRAGGGHVVVPAGDYRTGAVHLLSRVDLHLEHGARLAFSQDPAAYLPVVATRYEGTECYNYSAFVYAYGQRDVAITGQGMLDGRADTTHWWDWTGGPPPNEGPDKTALIQLAAAGVPVEERVFGEGHYLRPNLLQLNRCENVLVDGITVKDSPMWNIHPVLCRNVTIRGVTVDSPNGPNNDGIDPESCTDVLIENCTISTGDDCVAFKSGKDADGRRVNVPSRYAVVRNCTMADGNGGVTVGSETSGGVLDVFVRDCTMSSPHLERAIRIKSNPDRGGTITNIDVRRVSVGQAADSVIEIVLNYANVITGAYPPDVHGITISRLTVASAPRALNLLGLADDPLRDIHLHQCRFDAITEPNVITYVEGLRLDQVWINGTHTTK
ncbi:polygalacturonase [Kribbella aluminosa]|uniref:Polygalacturonase n=1 Tax=Kribbella aluminosa TaxID=416017 RepID=A0ABS4UH21_9ACTN|nr:glycoside hydrolase family 28 protein [Kribbella aluminosa]MBP2350944.1 polygalacturonase [Kribbella aluminosa]